MVRALLFDFDGLILDTETPDFLTWSELYRQYGHEFDHARWIQGVGTYGGVDPCAELLELIGEASTRPSLMDQFRQRYKQHCDAAVIRPGVIDLLDGADAAGIPAAVASSSERAWVEGWLTRHGIRDRFACIRSRDDVERVKPAPDLFLSAAACLGVDPADCLVLEDSPNGMRAAAAAGMRCVAVPIAINAQVELPPVAIKLSSLDELPFAELLERVRRVEA